MVGKQDPGTHSWNSSLLSHNTSHTTYLSKVQVDHFYGTQIIIISNHEMIQHQLLKFPPNALHEEIDSKEGHIFKKVIFIFINIIQLL